MLVRIKSPQTPRQNKFLFEWFIQYFFRRIKRWLRILLPPLSWKLESNTGYSLLFLYHSIWITVSRVNIFREHGWLSGESTKSYLLYNQCGPGLNPARRVIIGFPSCLFNLDAWALYKVFFRVLPFFWGEGGIL